VTGRHAGQNTGRPDYAYTGRHEAPAAERCAAHASVSTDDEEYRAMLVCNRHEHPGDSQHWDEEDGILWTVVESPAYAEPMPAGAVA
jgi:hypothetical protein